MTQFSYIPSVLFEKAATALSEKSSLKKQRSLHLIANCAASSHLYLPTASKWMSCAVIVKLLNSAAGALPGSFTVSIREFVSGSMRKSPKALFIL
jgi:hypothetical protein